MSTSFVVSYRNPTIVQRFDELIADGESQIKEVDQAKGVLRNSSRLSQWATSSLNLLDKLSLSTNRFVTEFERYGHVKADGTFNVGLALGVLKSAREEYLRGLAIDYHLSVSATIFGDILSEAGYLFEKKYLRAAAVLAGAALEEGLKTRARAIPLEVLPNDRLNSTIQKLRVHGDLSDFEKKKLEAIGQIRNDAAHGGEFNYSEKEISEMLKEVESTLSRLLGRQ